MPKFEQKQPEKELAERTESAKILAKKFQTDKGHEFKEATEEAFAKLLDETGYFDEARPADWVNDCLDKCDVLLKLEDGGWLAIQHSVQIPTEELLAKRDEIIKKGKITLPEHPELGEMPIVFVKDDYKNYVQRIKGVGAEIPWSQYYKTRLEKKPEAKLWKYFDNINEMISGWLNQIEESLNEEIKIHPEDKKIYEDYLEKIQKTKKMHAELTAS